MWLRISPHDESSPPKVLVSVAALFPGPDTDRLLPPPRTATNELSAECFPLILQPHATRPGSLCRPTHTKIFPSLPEKPAEDAVPVARRSDFSAVSPIIN